MKVWRHKSRIFLALVAFILLEANGEPEHDFGEKNSFLLRPQDFPASGKQLLFVIVRFGKEEFLVFEVKLRSLCKC